MTALAVAGLVVGVIVILAVAPIRIVREYHGVVVFRLGRLRDARTMKLPTSTDLLDALRDAQPDGAVLAAAHGA